MSASRFFETIQTQFGVASEDNLSPEDNFIRLRKLIPESTLLSVAHTVTGWPIEPIETLNCDPELKNHFGGKSRVLPLYIEKNRLGIAIDNPFSPEIDQLKTQYELDIRLISSHDLAKALQFSSETLAQDTTLDTLLRNAIIAGASDLHFTHTPQNIQLHYRRHGQLIALPPLAKTDWAPLAAGIKLHAQLDISVSQLPQDGHLRFSAGHDSHHDIRVSTLPTPLGEDIVLRFFEQKPLSTSFTDLGFTPTAEEKMKQFLAQKSGLILVTGATGSGKTTTLYTALTHLLAQGNRVIVTLEDPVETTIPGIRQSQINTDIGYTFSKGLRAILRQDPDVIMIGEIRDYETAKTALEAAYTGHLVLATLHTADCQSTLLRLNSFGLDPFWINYSLRGIISQQLHPKRCQRCLSTSGGCKHCHFTQKDGLLAVTEILEPSLDTPKFHLSWEDDLAQKRDLGWLPPLSPNG